MYVCAHMRYVQYASVCFRGRGIAGIPWMDSNEILRFSLSWARFSPVPPHHHPQHAATYSISEPRTSSTYMRNVIPDPEAASTLEHVWDSCILGSPILILYPPGGRPRACVARLRGACSSSRSSRVAKCLELRISEVCVSVFKTIN